MSITLPEEPLHGALITLRPWQRGEAEWYVSARDEEIFRWTTEPRELDAGAVREAIAQNAREPKYAGFAITERQTGALLGNISWCSRVLTDAKRRCPTGSRRRAAAEAQQATRCE